MERMPHGRDIRDDNQLLCFSVALWNGKDPILKERAFGLTNSKATTTAKILRNTTSTSTARPHTRT